MAGAGLCQTGTGLRLVKRMVLFACCTPNPELHLTVGRNQLEHCLAEFQYYRHGICLRVLNLLFPGLKQSFLSIRHILDIVGQQGLQSGFELPPCPARCSSLSA